MKVCTTCGTEKPLDQFPMKGMYYRGKCKMCTNERGKDYSRSYRSRDPERSRAQWRKWAAGADRREYYRQYREKNPEQERMRGQTRRARLRQAFVEVIEPFTVWAFTAGICYLCGENVSLARMHLDHIIPLARGGDHSYANVRATHPTCNMRKGVKLPHELGLAEVAYV